MSARWTAAAACLALLVCGARRLGAQDAVDFKLTGEVDSDVTASAEHPRSVFNAVTPFQGMDADGVVDGKLSFSRK